MGSFFSAHTPRTLVGILAAAFALLEALAGKVELAHLAAVACLHGDHLQADEWGRRMTGRRC